MLRVALVGAGNHSRANHAPSLRHFAEQHPGTVRLAAVCDLDQAKAERTRDEFGFERSCAGLEQLLDAGEVDALVTVMPIPAILPTSRLVFGQRIPVMIEKPLGRDLAEADAIVAAAEETGAPVMVSFNRRFDPAVRRALDWTRRHGPLILEPAGFVSCVFLLSFLVRARSSSPLAATQNAGAELLPNDRLL